MNRLRCGGVGSETIQVGTIYDVLDKISTVDSMEGNGVVMLGNVVNCEYWIATQLATSKLAAMERRTGMVPANGNSPLPLPRTTTRLQRSRARLVSIFGRSA